MTRGLLISLPTCMWESFWLLLNGHGGYRIFGGFGVVVVDNVQSFHFDEDSDWGSGLFGPSLYHDGEWGKSKEICLMEMGIGFGRFLLNLILSHFHQTVRHGF